MTPLEKADAAIVACCRWLLTHGPEQPLSEHVGAWIGLTDWLRERELILAEMSETVPPEARMAVAPPLVEMQRLYSELEVSQRYLDSLRQTQQMAADQIPHVQAHVDELINLIAMGGSATDGYPTL